MSFVDFVVKFDPKKDTPEDLTERVLYSLYVRRLKFNKPAITFIGGDSGEGKSISALALMYIIYKLQNQDPRKFLEISNIYTPLQFPEKIEKHLYDKQYKKANILIMHEAREIIKSKDWRSFLSTAVSDINAEMRSIKRMAVFILSQFIRDITSDMRYTLNYYIKVRRPMGGNKRARLNISVMWKDDRDLEKPKLKKRGITGVLVYPNNTRRYFTPKYLELRKPPKDIIEEFEKQDLESKKNIIKGKIDRLIKEMKIELEVGNDKIKNMIEWYTSNPESLFLIGKKNTRGNWKIKKQIKDMHDMTDSELKLFEDMLNDKLTKKGLIGKTTEEEEEELFKNGTE